MAFHTCSMYLPSGSWALLAQIARRMKVCPSPVTVKGDDVFEIWVVGFVGFDGIGAECVDGLTRPKKSLQF